MEIPVVELLTGAVRTKAAEIANSWNNILNIFELLEISIRETKYTKALEWIFDSIYSFITWFRIENFNMASSETISNNQVQNSDENGA